MLLELKNISKYYGAEGDGNYQMVLEKINFTIESGDSVAIIGPSGSGKSTLLNIAGSLDSPNIGEVLFKGNLINGMNDKELSKFRNKNIGFIFQQHHLLPQLSLLENVMLPVIPYSTKQEIKNKEKTALKLIERVGLSEHIHKYPPMLSGGECQRVAVIRALINRPEVIMADEPTGSLDRENALSLGKLLHEINSELKTAMIIVTHSSELASMFDCIYKLDKGRLILVNNLYSISPDQKGKPYYY